MTGAAEELASLTFEEYLAAEQVSQRRHEYVGGRVYVMSGGSERHALATQLVSDAFRPQARARGCRTFVADRMLRTAGAAYYPDFLVVCSSAADVHWEADASLIVEVTSPSTTDHDRREKASAYWSLPSLTHYLLLDPLRPAVEVALRGDLRWRWQAYGAGDAVVTPYGVLDLDALYAELDAEATT